MGTLPPSSFMTIPDITGLEIQLREHVRVLAVEIGERHVFRSGSLEAASGYIEAQFGRHTMPVRSQVFPAAGCTVRNVEAVKPGLDPTLPGIVIGAHYDSVPGSAGANDNATGVAALLEIAAAVSATPLKRTLFLVAFANEEPPFFRTSAMGSRVSARAFRSTDTALAGMLSLETIGYYDRRPGSQRYPPPLRTFYPNRGDYIGFAANVRSFGFARKCIRGFRLGSSFPSQWVAAPGWIPGLGWSDHWAFWREQYAGVMVTDTAPFRYPWYHTSADTLEKISFPDFARVVAGLQSMTLLLCNTDAGGLERKIPP